MTKRLLAVAVLAVIGCGTEVPDEQSSSLGADTIIGTWQAAVARDGAACTVDTWSDVRAFAADGTATRTVLGTTYPMLWAIAGDVLSISSVDALGHVYIKDEPYAWDGTVTVRDAKCIELHGLHGPSLDGLFVRK